LDSFFTRSGALNGLGSMAEEWVALISHLTSRQDLRPLTCLAWKDVISARSLIRPMQAWCPTCYDLWREHGMVLYQPLVWAVRIVTVCPLHQRQLIDRCPRLECRRRLTWLSGTAQIGWCYWCGSWLGERDWDVTHAPGRWSKPSAVPPVSPALVFGVTEQYEQRQVAAAVADLLESATSLETPPRGEDLVHGLQMVVSATTGGNIAAFARRLGRCKHTVWGWVRGRALPELEGVMTIAARSGVAPLDLIRGDRRVTQVRRRVDERRSAREQPRTPRRRPRPVNTVSLRAALRQVLSERREPPPSVTMVALRLGYDRRTLYRHCEKECRELGRRYRAEARQRGERRLRTLEREARAAVREIIGAGRYPSRRRVAQRLRKPGYLRTPEVRRVVGDASAEQ
jgi:TniQ